MNKIWFTSDSHFGHRNVIEHDKRPFKAANCSCVPATDTKHRYVCQACVDEMDRILIDKWNSQVNKNDTVWHLGDLCFRSKMPADWYIKRLNGRINIVWGNHDDSREAAFKYRDLFTSWQDYKYLKINGQKITLFHYKCEVWRSSGRGSWHLYGHSHGNIKPKVEIRKVEKARDQILSILFGPVNTEVGFGLPSKLPPDMQYASVKEILDELCKPILSKSLDVGLMNHNYNLLSYEEIEAFMATRGVTDHHAEEDNECTT